MKNVTANKRIISIALLTLSTAALAPAQIVLNPSFETGIDPEPYPGHSAPLTAVDSTSIPGWTVSGGTLDYVGSRWQAADGMRSIDLTGSSPGQLTQTISGFTIGQQYRLSFQMAANPEPGPYPPIRSLTASIASASQTYSFAVDSHTATSMGWTLETLDFTATASSLALTFTSLTSGLAGPTLDAVSISTVPEPSAIAMFGLAAFAATSRSVRRHRVR